MARPLVLLALVACAACCGGASAEATLQQHGDAGRQGRRLLAVKAGGDAAGVIHSGMGHQETAAARLCVMQCLQHACISWHKIYMGESSSSLRDAAAVPASAAECLHRCGMPEVESGCVAQTYHRVLNTYPLQYSCSSGCVTGLLHSTCRQCGGSGSGCAALQLNVGVADAECMVDAAV